MSNKPFEEAVDRAERALLRIERAIEYGPSPGTGREEVLRSRVAEALGELDEIIREASHG